MRTHARQGDPRALGEVARQFEAYFLQQMLKSMRKASLGDPLFGGNQSSLYRDMADQQMALALASDRGSGLASTFR